MSAPDPSPDSESKAQTAIKRWLIITYLLLVIMALFSALGAFIIRIFFIAVLFSSWKVVEAWLDKRRSATYHVGSNSFSGSSSRAYRATREVGKQPGTFPDLVGLVVRAVRSWPIHVKITAAIWAFLIFVFVCIFSLIDFTSEELPAEFYYITADNFYNAEQYDSAYVYYKKALAIQRDYPEALFGYGNTLYTKNYPDSSVYYYNLALEIDPDFDDAKYNTAWVYFYQRKYDRSIERLTTLLDDNSSYYVGMQLMGDNYYAKNQYDDAISWYEQAYSNGIRDGFFCQRMAYIYDTRNNRTRAIELYKEAVSYDNTLKDAYRRLGELLSGEEGEAYRKQAAALP